MSVVVTQIRDVIYSRLLPLHGATVAGVEMSVVLSSARGTSPEHGQIAIGYGPNTRVQYVPGNPVREDKLQTFIISIGIRDETSDMQLMEQAMEVYGEVVAALKESGTSNWHTFDSLAIDGEIGDFEPIETSGRLGGIRLPVEVYYRTPEAALDTVG